jgi:hypothetical protein
LTICAPGKLGLTEEIDRLELKDGLGNLTLGYFMAMDRQAAFRKLAGAEDFVARLEIESEGCRDGQYEAVDFVMDSVG